MPLVHDVEKAHALALNLDKQRRVLSSLRQDDLDGGAVYARRLRNLAELERLSAEKPSHAVMEVAGTFKVGQAKSCRMLEHGRRAVHLFPRAVELLESGAVHPATVELLLHLTAKASEEVQAEVGARVTDQLVECDAVDARALIVETLLEVEADLDPDGVVERHAQARANRGVWVKPVEDGMARIGAEVDQITGRRFQLDLDELCRAQKVADHACGTERTPEQRRADVLGELPGRHLALLQALREGRTAGELVADPTGDVLAQLMALPVRNPARMYVHSPMTMLLELDNRSGYVEGLGPISAHQARLLRPVAELQALWVDATTGIPLGMDPTVHPAAGEPDWTDEEQVRMAAEQVRQRLRSMLRPAVVDDRAEPGRLPSKALSRQVQIRDLRCTGPGCPRHGKDCEHDHLVAVSDGGLTAVWTIGLKSPRCHHARHDGWEAVRDEATGATTWFSPLGGRYTRRSPWRPPPKIRTSLPPPALDRPDRGKKRTFGAPSAEPADPAEVTVRTSAGQDGGWTSWFDVQRQRKTERTEPPCQPPEWGRPWHDDAPPPF